MAAERYEGVRISRTGEPGSDVLISGKEWEVKLTKNMGALMRGWLTQAARQGSEGVLFKENLGKWYVVIEGDKFFNQYVEVEFVKSLIKSDDPSL